MATLTETDYTKVATEAALQFADLYYSALDGHRFNISTYYVPATTQENGRGLPSITYNGELLQDATSFQQRWEKEMPRTHFEVQSVNTHVLNGVMAPMSGKGKAVAERNMSLIVQVSGSVRLGERKEGPLRGFSDSFVLVPNTAQITGGGKDAKSGKKWLIQSQTFRFVV